MLALLALALSTAPPADLAAVGVVVARRPEASVAILRSGGRSRVVAVGETAFGGRVAAVSSGGVVLEFEGVRTELRLTAGAAPPAPAPAPPVAAAAAPDARSMDRREVEQRLAQETSRILAETSLVPVQDGSQVSGFAITRMPEGTLLSDAGLRPGDIVTEVNGTAIDSLATLISLWPRLQNETTLRAVVLRGGQPVTLTVSLR
jgi:general secretion pathway protein C